MDIVNELKKERHEIRKRMQSIVEIISANSSFKGDITKKVVHDSRNVILQLTTMKEGSINTVENLPFDSDVFLVEGAVDVEKGNIITRLTDKNPLMELFKGDSALGTAKTDAVVITKIKTV